MARPGEKSEILFRISSTFSFRFPLISAAICFPSNLIAIFISLNHILWDPYFWWVFGKKNSEKKTKNIFKIFGGHNFFRWFCLRPEINNKLVTSFRTKVFFFMTQLYLNSFCLFDPKVSSVWPRYDPRRGPWCPTVSQSTLSKLLLT